MILNIRRTSREYAGLLVASLSTNGRCSISFGWTLPKSQIALPEGPMWRSHRRLMGPSMSPTYLNLMSPRIGKNVSNLIRLWETKQALLEPSGGAAFEAAPDIQLFTMVGGLPLVACGL